MARLLVQHPVAIGLGRNKRIPRGVIGKASAREVLAGRAVVAGLDPCSPKKAAAEVRALALLLDVVLVKQFVVVNDDHAEDFVVESDFCEVCH